MQKLAELDSVFDCADATITLGLARDALLYHLKVDPRARADRDNALGRVQQGNSGETNCSMMCIHTKFVCIAIAQRYGSLF